MRLRPIHLLALIALPCLASPGSVSAQMPACPVGVADFDLPGLSPHVAGSPAIPMVRRTLDATLYPDAVCNDGTPAVIYFRPVGAAYVPTPHPFPDSDKWLIYLDGGGGCRSADDCFHTRWCGLGGRVFDAAGKMSTAGAWPAVDSPHGIFELFPPGGLSNHFAEYHHVWVVYCSSDNWAGSADHVGLNTNQGVAVDLAFHGGDIVDAVFDTLLSGPVTADADALVDTYTTALPSLRDATEIVIAGESAGGGGVRHHIDRLSALLAVEAPAAAVLAILDAGAPPGLWDPAIDWSDPFSPGDYLHYLTSLAEPVLRSFWGADDTHLDASCLATQPDPALCTDTTWTLANDITTPFFLRQDLSDPLGQQRYVQWGLFPAPMAYFQAQETLLAGLAAAGAGIQGINCGEHVAIRRNDGFFAWLPAIPGGGGLSFHDLVVGWLTGVGVAAQIQPDNPFLPGWNGSFCP